MPEIKPLYIERPIEVKEVYDYLEVDKYLGTWDVGYICGNAHGKINMWSKKKPVVQANTVLGKPKTPTTDGNPDWWRGHNGRCGLSFPIENSYKDIRSLYTADKANGWEYETIAYSVTIGGVTKWVFRDYARLTDFEYYMYSAGAPYRGFSNKENGQVGKGRSATFQLLPGFAILPPEDGTELPYGGVVLSDISSGYTVQRPVPGSPTGTTEAVERLGDWYLGVAIYEGTSYRCRVVGNSLGPITVPAEALAFASIGDKLTAYPFLCPMSMAWNEADINTYYTSVPGAEKVEFEIVSKDAASGFEVYLSAKYNYQDKTPISITINYSVTKEGSGDAVDLKNNTVWVRFAGNDIEDPLYNGERYYEQADIYLTSDGQVYRNTVTHNINSAYRDRGYIIYLTLQSGAYRYSTYPIAIADPEV